MDLARDRSGKDRTRLPNVLMGRSDTTYAGWLDAQDETFGAGIRHATRDPFLGYATALRDSLSDAVSVLNAFHVVQLGPAVLDEIQRRAQQEQLGLRGPTDDPLHTIRGLPSHGVSTAPNGNAPSCLGRGCVADLLVSSVPNNGDVSNGLCSATAEPVPRTD